MSHARLKTAAIGAVAAAALAVPMSGASAATPRTGPAGPTDPISQILSELQFDLSPAMIESLLKDLPGFGNP